MAQFTITITVTTPTEDDPADTLEEIEEALGGTMLTLTERGWSGTIDIVGKRPARAPERGTTGGEEGYTPVVRCTAKRGSGRCLSNAADGQERCYRHMEPAPDRGGERP